MATDPELHIIGTKIIHMVPAWVSILLGLLLGSSELQAFGVGILIVVLASNMRAQSPHYRWRVDADN